MAIEARTITDSRAHPGPGLREAGDHEKTDPVLRRLGLAWTFVAVSAACSGPKFTSNECRGDCAGQSSGGAAGSSGSTSAGTNSGEGGETTGGVSGAGAAGSDTGGSSTGGMNMGGMNMGGMNTGGSNGGSSGNAGSSTSDFPRHGVLDDFAREELGGDWNGAADSYGIESEALSCSAGFCPGAFWAEPFGVTQEVFATLVSFSSDAPEINLVLKAQSSTTCDLLEILYAPPLERLSVEACWDGDGNWQSFGFVDIALEPGDQLGGRVGADGFVELFRNGVRVGRFDANDFPFIRSEGRIGVDGLTVDGQALVWDDFGGG